MSHRFLRAFASPALLLFLASGFSVHAAGSSNIAAGARIAAAGTPTGATACASCHGARGEGVGAFPYLAGSGAAYLRGQLEAFATGTRKNPIMQPIAQALSADERTQIASYYAGLQPRRVIDREPRGAFDTGPWLATRGRWGEDIPACAQCHGPGGSGVGSSFPPLAGQPASYLVEQLKAWQGGARPPGPLGLMETIARKLKDSDIKAVSEYYAGLAAAAAGTPAAAAKKVTP